jgi:hypothetical protein
MTWLQQRGHEDIIRDQFKPAEGESWILQGLDSMEDFAENQK